MSRLLQLFAWIAAACMSAARKAIGSQTRDRPALADSDASQTRGDLALADPDASQTRDRPALVQDRRSTHATTAAPHPALAELRKRDDAPRAPPPIKIFRGRRVDGNTSWRIDTPTGPPLLPHLDRLEKSGRRTVELRGRDGPQAFRLRRKGRRLILESAFARIELQPERVELVVTSLAIETVGLLAWFRDWLPRAHWWVAGEELDGSALAQAAAASGWYQHRIEQCLDVGGLELKPGIEDAIVAGKLVVSPILRAGQRIGVEIGKRNNPEQATIYNKPAQLEAGEGVHEALVQEVQAGGWSPGEAWTRVELRSRGDGLVVRCDGEVVFDGRHPGAALDDSICAALWRRGTTRIRVTNPGSAKRRRDWEATSAWVAIQDAAPVVYDESARLAMGRGVKAQWESTHASRVTALRRASVAVGVLERAQDLSEAAEIATRRVREELARPTSAEELIRARAEYAELLEHLEREGADE